MDVGSPVLGEEPGEAHEVAVLVVHLGSPVLQSARTRIVLRELQTESRDREKTG